MAAALTASGDEQVLEQILHQSFEVCCMLFTSKQAHDVGIFLTGSVTTTYF
jgi:hypothetical protein